MTNKQSHTVACIKSDARVEIQTMLKCHNVAFRWIKLSFTWMRAAQHYISSSKSTYAACPTHLEAVQHRADPCWRAQGPDPASGAGSSSSPPAPSGSCRFSPLAGDSTQPVIKSGTRQWKIWTWRSSRKTVVLNQCLLLQTNKVFKEL